MRFDQNAEGVLGAVIIRVTLELADDLARRIHRPSALNHFRRHAPGRIVFRINAVNVAAFLPHRGRAFRGARRFAFGYAFSDLIHDSKFSRCSTTFATAPGSAGARISTMSARVAGLPSRNRYAMRPPASRAMPDGS